MINLTPKPNCIRLRQDYVVSRISLDSLASIYRVDPTVVVGWLDSCEIPLRKRVGRPTASTSTSQTDGGSAPAPKRAPTKARVIARGGKRADLGGQYFRSSWEANFARYLNFLLAKGDIQAWDYEAIEFEFHKIKRGSRFYKADFRSFDLSGNATYYEIKGHLDQKSKTKLSRMQRYFPNIKIVVIGRREYTALARVLSKVIPFWE